MPRAPLAFACLVLAALASRPAPAQSWSGAEGVEVRVEDPKGKSVAGAEVVLAPAGAPAGIALAPVLTDARGRAAIGGLAAGSWELEVRRPGFMTYAAEIVLSNGKPVIASAAHRNVPGATATMRIRLGRAPGAPPPQLVVSEPRVVPPPRPRNPIAEAPASSAAVVPASPPSAPAPAEQPVPAEAVPAHAEPPLAPPAPKPVAAMAAITAPAVRAAPPKLPDVPSRSVPQEAVPSIAAPAPAPAPSTPRAAPIGVQAVPPPSEPPPPVNAPAPATPARRALVSAHAEARNCFECRPGESARGLEVAIGNGGERCPGDLRARLAAAPPAEWPALGATLPSGCALLVIEVSSTERFSGFRYEASAPSGRPDDCRPGQECAAGACRFLGDPVLRQDQGKTFAAAIFESDAERDASFVVYTRPTR